MDKKEDKELTQDSNLVAAGSKADTPVQTDKTAGNEAKPKAKTKAPVKDAAKATAKPETVKVPEAPSKLDTLIESYKKAYPKESAFHVTSDNQVFLNKDAALAKMHQRGIDKEKQVQTIQVK